MEKHKVIFLCSGDILGTSKKVKPCIHSKIDIAIEEIPLFAGSYRTKKVEFLSIYCKFKHRYVRREKTMCPHYQNTTLINDAENRVNVKNKRSVKKENVN